MAAIALCCGGRNGPARFQSTASTLLLIKRLCFIVQLRSNYCTAHVHQNPSRSLTLASAHCEGLTSHIPSLPSSAPLPLPVPRLPDPLPLPFPIPSLDALPEPSLHPPASRNCILAPIPPRSEAAHLAAMDPAASLRLPGTGQMARFSLLSIDRSESTEGLAEAGAKSTSAS